MSIQATGAGKRFRVSHALVALALAVAVFVLAVQASSTWSTRNELQVQPRQAIVAPASDVDMVDSSHIGPHCRPKYGCEAFMDSGHIRLGCRLKYGCKDDAGTVENP